MNKVILVFGLLAVGISTASYSEDSNLEKFPDEIRNNFMDPCMAGSDFATCECMLEDIEQKFSVEEFIALELSMQTGSSVDKASMEKLSSSFLSCSSYSDSDEFSDEIRSNFMDSCMVEGDFATCDCALEEIEQKFSVEEFIALDLSMKTGGGADEADLEKLSSAFAPCLQ